MTTRRVEFLVVLAVAASANCQLEKGGLATVVPGVTNDGPGADASAPTNEDAAVATGGTPAVGGASGSSSIPGSGGSIDLPTTTGGSASLDGGIPGSGGIPATGGTMAWDGATSSGGGALAPHDASVATGGSGGSITLDANATNEPQVITGLDASAATDLRAGGDGHAGHEASTTPPDASWSLVWSDEFDSASVAGVDASKWNYVTWNPRQVNAELQKYTSRLENVFQDGEGHLVLRALNMPYNGFTYTSGRIDSSGKFSFKFGRVEVRAKLPSGLGSFPGILLLGTTGNWPQCGELALMEQYGQDKSTMVSSAYAGGPAAGDVGPTKFTFPDATSASSDFHVYALDWYSDHVSFQVDGLEVAHSTFPASSPLATIPEYLVLDVALGGDKGGAIKASDFPMEMVVDYVRVYALP